jgi:hypothetical protein
MSDSSFASSPRLRARIAGLFYLVTFVAGSLALALPNASLPVNLIANAAYLGVTVLFYQMFKPVNNGLSLLAAFFSVLGITTATLSLVHLSPIAVNPLGFFGFYCLLIGYLIVRSTFLPKVLGVLMALGGLSWLTFFSPALVNQLNPYNLAPGILAEGVLTLWLLAVGLNEQRWSEQNAASSL